VEPEGLSLVSYSLLSEFNPIDIFTFIYVRPDLMLPLHPYLGLPRDLQKNYSLVSKPFVYVFRLRNT
jgi:hypothetical protein